MESELEKFTLITRFIFVLLLNTLAADEKYVVLNTDNLTIPIQIHLSQKRKAFSQFLAAFLKSSLNFKHFQKEDDPPSFSILKIADSENVVR